MEGQQAIVYLLDLLSGQNQQAIPYSETGSQARKGAQINREGQQGRALAGSLMAVICSQQNIGQASALGGVSILRSFLSQFLGIFMQP